MDMTDIIRTYAPIRGLRLFNQIPENCIAVRIHRAGSGSIYSPGMYVIVDQTKTDLVEGVDVARIMQGGPRDGFEKVAHVSQLRYFADGWCTAPAGGGHSQALGTGKPVTLIDGPYVEEGLRTSILGHVIGYLGEVWGEPIRDLWPEDMDRPWQEKAYRLGDIPTAYAMECEGVCLHPIFADGSRLRFSAVEPVTPGDYVCLWLKPRFYHQGIEHQCMVKRLVTPIPIGPMPLPEEMPAPPVVLVEMLNPPRKFAIPLNRIIAVHKCLGAVQNSDVAQSNRAAAGSQK